MAKNLHGSAFSFHVTRGNVKFLSCKQRILQSVREFARSLETGCTGRKFVRTRGVYLVWTVQRADTEKEVSRNNNEGKGYGVRAVGTPLMVLFNKSSSRILPVYQILVNPWNGLF